MSSSGVPPELPPAPVGRPAPRNGCLTALMVLIGLILMLPGLCAVIFTIGTLSSPSGFDNTFLSIVLFALMAGAAGVALIWMAVRERR
jgi:hypothetical protein